MTDHFKTISDAVEFLDALQEDIKSGEADRKIKYQKDIISEKLKDARSHIVYAQQVLDRMEVDSEEVINRVAFALENIEKEFKSETKFLKILIEQKLAPDSFHQQIVDVMCDISDAQAGLVGAFAAIAAIDNYVKVLKLIRIDPILNAEMQNILGK